MITTTAQSLKIVEDITERIGGQTFHHHFHILYDLPLPSAEPTYLEIGCYAGASAILMLQRPGVSVVSIDLGSLVHPSIVKFNIEANNPLGNNFRYVLGNSHEQSVFDSVKDLSVDLLFIDGDHTSAGVEQDWKWYSELVIPNGWIVFDDYNDRNCPGVRPAVDAIVKNLDPRRYHAYGTVPNIHGARGFSPDYVEGNCYVIRRLAYEMTD